MYEIRTKRGIVKRGDLVVTTDWQAIAPKAIPSVFADDPNIKIRKAAVAALPAEAEDDPTALRDEAAGGSQTAATDERADNEGDDTPPEEAESNDDAGAEGDEPAEDAGTPAPAFERQETKRARKRR